MATGFGVSPFGASPFGTGLTLGDLTAPFLQNQNPASSQTGVNPRGNIVFEISDNASAIDQSSVIISIERGSGWETVWTGDAQQSGFVVTKNVISSTRIEYTINPDLPLLPEQLIQIRVQASDIAANALDTTYSFTTDVALIWYAGGQYGQLRKSTDGGVNWSVFTTPTALDVYAMHGLSSKSFWIGTKGNGSTTQGQIWYYDGSSWTLQYTDTGVNRYVVNMFMASASEGYAITTDWYADQFRILKWNGTTWSIVDSPWSSPVRTIHADGNGNVIAGAAGHQSNYQVRYSLNSGSTWSWGVDDHNRPNAGCWIDDDGNWYYLTGQFTTGVNLGLFKSSDPSVAFTQILTISNPKTVNQVVRTENSLWFDGSKFYILGSTTGGQKQILVFDPVALTETWFDCTTTLTSIHGTSSVDIKVACDSNSNPNNVVDFNGATAVDRDVQAGGTSAKYYAVFGYLDDTTPPFLSGQDPAPDDTAVSVNKDIELAIEDSNSSVDQSSIVISIERGSGWETVWTSDTQQSGFVVTKTVVTQNKIQFSINPDLVFNRGQLIQVRVQADDTFSPANSLDETYSFTIIEGVTWYVGNGTQVRYSTDGTTWNQLVDHPASGGIWAIYGLDANNIWIGWRNGRIYYYDGTSWTDQIFVSGWTCHAIWMVNASLGWSRWQAYDGGESQSIYKWDGNSWTLSYSFGGPVGSGVTADTNDVAASRGYASPYNCLYYSANGGTNWYLGGSSIGTSPLGIFKDGSYWYVFGFNAGVYRTTDLTSAVSLLFGNPAGHSLRIWGTTSANRLFVHEGEVFVAASENPDTTPKKIVHYNGSLNVYGPTSRAINSVFGSGTKNVKYGLSQGYVANFNGSGFTETYTGAGSDVSAIWATGDIDGPYLADQSPSDNSIGVSTTSNVSFEIIDEKTDIDQASVIISIDRGSGYETVWTGDTQQSGFVVTKTVLTSYQVKYEINPDDAFTKNETIVVRVQANDTNGNSIDETFSFEVELLQVWYVVGGRGGASPYGKIYRSLDKINWPEMSQLPAGGAYPINCIHGTDPNNIWVGLASNGSNSFSSIWYFNGKSWAQQYQFILDYAFVTSIYMLSETLGYAAAYRGVTTKTVYVLKWDGNNWSIISSYGTGGDYISTIHARGNIIMHGIVNSSPGQPIIRYSLNGGSSWAYGADVVSSGGNPIAGGATSGVWVGDDGKYYWMRKYSGLYRSTDLSANFTQIVPDSGATGWIPGSGKGNSIWGAGGDDIYFGYGILSEGGVAVGHWNGSTVVTVDTNQRAIQSLYGVSRQEIGTAYNTGLGNGRAVITNGLTYSVIATSPGLTGDMYGVYGFGDITPPYLQNQNPAPSDTGVAKNSNIYLEVTDDDSTLNQSTIVISIERGSGWETVWTGDAQQTGYAVSKVVVNDSLIQYTINPDVDFTGFQTIQVRVQGSDTAESPNVMDETYSFQIADTTAPHIENQDPAEGSNTAAAGSNIFLDVVDSTGNLDSNSVVIYVEGTICWQNDTQQNSFVVTKSAVTNGFRYEINPPTDFSEGQVVTVRVVAEDIVVPPNTLDTSYDFTILSTAPVLQNLDPFSGETNVGAGTNIVLEIIDSESGVNPTTVTLTVAGTTVYQSGAQQNGYTVTVAAITDGYRYTIDPPTPLPGGSCTVGVIASNTAETVATLNTSYSFEIYLDTGGPTIINKDPEEGADGVLITKGISFSIIDSVAVDLTFTKVWVDSEIVYDGTTDLWAAGWTQSSYTANSLNGYDFFIVNDSEWSYGSEVEVAVLTRDSSWNETDESWTFVITGEPFPFSLFRFMIKAIQNRDTRSPGLIQRLIETDGGLNDVWEQRIIDRQVELQNTLFNPYTIDSKWLPWLKSKVGFTRNLSFQATETELRKIIANAVNFWNLKPSESAINAAIRMLTGNPFRIRNYFDFRMQEGVTYITEVLENFDPNVLSFVSQMPSGDDLQWCYSGSSYPCSHQFFIHDLPSELFPNGLFNLESATYMWLQITSWPDDIDFQRTYRIDYLTPGSITGVLKASEPAGPNSDKSGSWRLIGANSEYITEVRLVDELTGDGAVNRTLVEFLIERIRSCGERIDVIYLAFLDEFLTAGDLLQWTTVNDPTVPLESGYCLLSPAQSITTNVTGMNSWGEQSTAFKVSGAATSQLRLKFLISDSNNFYFVLVNYSAQTIGLYKMVSGSPTQIGSTISLGALLQPDVVDVFRVDIADAGSSGVQIRIRYNGEIFITELDTAFALGGVGCETITGTDDCKIYMVEVMTLPVTVSRVGPNP